MLLTAQLDDAGSTCRHKQVSARHGQGSIRGFVLDYYSNTTASNMMIITLIAQLLCVVEKWGKRTSNLEEHRKRKQ